MPDYLHSPTVWVMVLGSAAITAGLVPLVIRIARRIGAVDTGGYRRAGSDGVPRLGGIAVAVPFIGACLLAWWGPTVMLSHLEKQRADLAVLALGALAILAVGAYDDSRGLRARYKLLAQLAVAGFICASGNVVTTIALPLIGKIEFGYILGTVFTILWIVGLINAFNLVDGIDGLAAGIGLIGAAAMAVLAAINGATFVVILCVSLAASLLGFLAWNSHPARIYLGDSGSMFLGYALATIALMGSYKSRAACVFLAPVLALGFPIYETLSSMLRRWLRGRPIFTGDQGHTHHRLLRKGYSHRQVAWLLYIAALACAAAGILQEIVPAHPMYSLMPAALYIATVLWVAWVADYLRPWGAGNGGAATIGESRQRNVILSAFARYAALRLSHNGTNAAVIREVLSVGCKELGLRFLEARLDDGMLLLRTGNGCTANAELRTQNAECRPETADRTAQNCINPINAVNPVESNLSSPMSYSGADPSIHNGQSEIMKVRSADGHVLHICYEHDQAADETERQDVAACLAHLFENVYVAAARHQLELRAADL